MSLSEQLQRVDGGQNAALKVLIEKFGGTVTDTTKIDGYANILSSLIIYSKQELLSDNTEEEIFGNTQGRTVDDAFMGILDCIEQSSQEVSNMFQISSYVGTGGEGARTLNFNQTPLMVLILGENGGYAIFLAGAEAAYSTNGSSNNRLTTTWTGASLRYTGASAAQLMNVSGVTYQVIAFVPITSGE